MASSEVELMEILSSAGEELPPVPMASSEVELMEIISDFCCGVKTFSPMASSEVELMEIASCAAVSCR